MTASRPPVDPSAITDIAILAIEGERDDISGLGQTKAALTIAKALPG
jgi:poly(3-hydroxybutyrate) depolymerase